MRAGICVAGNMIVDITYPVEGWPKQGELVHIHDGILRSTGGAVCNVAVDLKKLDGGVPVYAMGRIGDDAEGDLIEKTLGEHGVDCGNVIREGISAFCNVMADVKNKQRTFFTYMGANARFTEEDIDWSKVSAKIFHIGYILLLDALDQEDAEYGSRFRRLVPPALRYADYCVINEYEAEQTTGIRLRDEAGALIRENIPQALRAMKAMGVSTWAVIHCPEGGYGLDEAGQYVQRGSLILPPEKVTGSVGDIKGSVGAGDAFCAGVLLGAEKGWTLERSIDLGIAAAASSLFDPSATAGVCSAEEAAKMLERYDRRQP